MNYHLLKQLGFLLKNLTNIAFLKVCIKVCFLDILIINHNPLGRATFKAILKIKNTYEFRTNP
ncbi:hypothetical protein DMB91_00775 [Campylobacter sp. MIT 97-5078]|nr:hypothetical protein LR59_00830 [Campylobacter sp. MIT 97-5078]TQR28220.1 hypothetical protein DMB91_00775 [Campylobacter sp. MIT 97-5078]